MFVYLATPTSSSTAARVKKKRGPDRHVYWLNVMTEPVSALTFVPRVQGP